MENSVKKEHIDSLNVWLGKIHEQHKFIMANKQNMTKNAIGRYVTKVIKEVFPEEYQKGFRSIWIDLIKRS